MNKEYELEHFGFTHEQSSLERKYFLQKIIANALDAMVSKFNVNEQTSEILVLRKKEVFENMWMSLKDEIDDLSNLDAKYFTVPSHVLLPSDFDQVKSYTEENELNLDKELDELKNTFLQNSVMLAALNSENAQYTDLSTFVDSEVKLQNVLKESFNSVCLDKIRYLVHEIINKNI